MEDPGHTTRRVATAERIMMQFADRTGLSGKVPLQRYLWTDAFAVCNFLSLARATHNEGYLALALQLVDAVHRVLGRHRDDDARTGWLSGLSEDEGSQHPTMGGLRIGKRLPERTPQDPFDSDLEWDRDGQYFHYLTKWMHALDQVSRYRDDPKLNLWARELAEAAHRAFVHDSSLGDGPAGMFWKMSIDLRRPLVSSMGQHDPLDGFITALELQDTASRLTNAPAQPDLAGAIVSFAKMIDVGRLATADPLGIGGLLMDGCRLAQSSHRDAPAIRALLHAILGAATLGLRALNEGEFARPPEIRLAFRELGLAIGLKAVASIQERTSDDPTLFDDLEFLRARQPLGETIVSFWLDPTHQDGRSWSDHREINEVMLATTLVPDGFLLLSGTEARSSTC